jgi:hypothetical protein
VAAIVFTSQRSSAREALGDLLPNRIGYAVHDAQRLAPVAPQARAVTATISARDARDAASPQLQKSGTIFWNRCGLPYGSHALQPSRPQSVRKFPLAGDAYSVSGWTVRSPQVAPWLSAEPSSSRVAYPSPDAQAASPVIPTVIFPSLLIIGSVSAHTASMSATQSAARATGKAFLVRRAEPNIRARTAAACAAG